MSSRWLMPDQESKIRMKEIKIIVIKLKANFMLIRKRLMII